MQRKLILEKTLYTPEQLRGVTTQAGQIALAGRSNVGKSSLINALAGRKDLAKVSASPGKTASLNFYRVEPEGFYLVDLPGYGYARRSKTDRGAWASLIEAYLRGSKELAALVLLLDCRLTPQAADLELLAFARSLRLNVLPVLTKADKCKRQEQIRRQREWSAHLGRPPLLTSVPARSGLDELWVELCAQSQAPAPYKTS